MAARLRVAGISATSPPRLRVAGITADGTTPVNPRLRVAGLSATGTAYPVLAAVTANAASAEPSQVVTLTATLAPGSPTPDTYVWSRLSGPAGTLTASGATATFTAPSIDPPGTQDVVLSCRAKVGTVSGNTVSVAVTVLPQTDWTRVPGGSWVGAS